MKMGKIFYILLTAWFCCALSATEYKSCELNIETVKGQEKAASELLYHWQKIAGNKVTSAPEALKVVIGRQPPKKRAPKKGESNWFFTKGTLYIWGDDNGSRNGTLFAVYDFLEKKLGVRWIFPGKDGIYAPVQKTIKLEERERSSRRPAFLWTTLRGYFWIARGKQSGIALPRELILTKKELARRNSDNKLFMLRMRHGRVAKVRYGHAFGKWAERFGETHPEYFGMDAYGKHRPVAKRPDRSKLCLTNPAVQEQIIADWKAAGRPKYWNVCPNDGSLGFCRCPKCMALDTRTPEESFYDHLTDRYLWFWNQLIAKMRPLRQDVVLVTYVYSYYRFPPRREKVEYPDNLLCGLVPSILEDNAALFSQWQKAGLKHCFLRPNDLCSYSAAIRGWEKVIYDKFQQTRTFNISGVDYDSSFGRAALDLEGYVVARMITAPEKSFEEIYTEYCDAFGPASSAVRKVYDNIRQAGEAALKLEMNRIENKRLLDDSLLKFNTRKLSGVYRSALAMLQNLPEKSITLDNRPKLERLKLALEHSILAHEFISAASGNDQNFLEKCAEKLLAFRIKNSRSLHDLWRYVFYGTERKIWQRTRCGTAFLKKNPQKSADLASYWRSSFDTPALDNWSAKEAFDGFSDKEASFDRFSISVKKGNKKVSLLSREVPVTPGAKYRISFDAKSSGKTAFELKVTGDGKNLAELKLEAGSKNWKSASTELTVPANCNCVSMQLLRGKTTAQSWIDNIEFTRL